MLSTGTLLLQKYGYKEIRKIGEGAGRDYGSLILGLGGSSLRV